MQRFNWCVISTCGNGCYFLVTQSHLHMTSGWFAKSAHLYRWWQLQWIHFELETDRSCLATKPGILASTCKVFDFWLCNPRVSDRGGNGLHWPSGMPLESTWITARVEVPPTGGSTSYFQILGATAFDNLLASEEGVWTFFLRVGNCTGLRGVSVESITSIEVDTRCWTAKQGPVVVAAKRGSQWHTQLNIATSPRHKCRHWIVRLWTVVLNCTFPDSRISLLSVPYLLWIEN